MKVGSRRIVSLALAAAMVLSSSPIAAFAEEVDATFEEEPLVELVDEGAEDEEDLLVEDGDELYEAEPGEDVADSDQVLDEEDLMTEEDDEEQVVVDDAMLPEGELDVESETDAETEAEAAPDAVADAEKTKDETNDAQEEEAELALQGNGEMAKAATAITLGKTVTHKSDSVLSKYYKFTLTSAGRLTITMKGSVNWYYSLYDLNEHYVVFTNAEGNSSSGTNTSAYNLTKGTYYIGVSAKGSCTFTTSFASSGESFSEAQGGSNNQFSSANAINLATTYKGQIAINDDVDYYKFTMPSSEKLTISCATPMYLHFAIYDSSQKYVWSQSAQPSGGTLNYKGNVSLTKGTYYLQVQGYVHHDSGTGVYTFSLTTPSHPLKTSLANATVSSISQQTYTGKAITPKPTVKVGSKTLTLNTDYTLSYKNNTLPGTATVTVTGKGSYTGTKNVTFKIKGPFSDVTSSTPHCTDILWLKSSGITTGFSDGTYRPYSNVTRCDMAAFLYRLAGSPKYTPSAKDKAKFSDVNSKTPHAKEIWWLASKGISTGWKVSNNKYQFRPYSNVARADMAAFLYRLAGSPKYTPTAKDKAKFADVNSKTPHAKEIWWLASKGVSEGWKSGSTYQFRPYSSVARADMAAFLHRMKSKSLI